MANDLLVPSPQSAALSVAPEPSSGSDPRRAPVPARAARAVVPHRRRGPVGHADVPRAVGARHHRGAAQGHPQHLHQRQVSTENSSVASSR